MGDWRLMPSVKSTIEKLRYFRKNRLFTDVTFIVGTDEIKDFGAHRNVVACGSQTLEELVFGSSYDQSGGKIRISDVEGAIFECILDFLYDEIVFCSSTEMARALFKAAGKYDLTNLKRFSEEFICDHIKEEGEIKYLQMAIELDMEYLKEICLRNIAVHAADILSDREFRCLPIHVVEAILKMPSLKASEAQILRAILEWREANENICDSEMVKHLLCFVDFDYLRAKEFSEVLIKFKEFLTKSEMREMLMYLVSPTVHLSPIWYKKQISKESFSIIEESSNLTASCSLVSDKTEAVVKEIISNTQTNTEIETKTINMQNNRAIYKEALNKSSEKAADKELNNRLEADENQLVSNKSEIVIPLCIMDKYSNNHKNIKFLEMAEEININEEAVRMIVKEAIMSAVSTVSHGKKFLGNKKPPVYESHNRKESSFMVKTIENLIESEVLTGKKIAEREDDSLKEVIVEEKTTERKSISPEHSSLGHSLDKSEYDLSQTMAEFREWLMSERNSPGRRFSGERESDESKSENVSKELIQGDELMSTHLESPDNE